MKIVHIYQAFEKKNSLAILSLQGRKGRGSIFVFAAGNGGYVNDSCAFNGLVNSIYTIAISGVNKDGSLPQYGERCPGILAVTYSREMMFSADTLVSIFSRILSKLI